MRFFKLTQHCHLGCEDYPGILTPITVNLDHIVILRPYSPKLDDPQDEGTVLIDTVTQRAIRLNRESTERLNRIVGDCIVSGEACKHEYLGFDGHKTNCLSCREELPRDFKSNK